MIFHLMLQIFKIGFFENFPCKNILECDFYLPTFLGNWSCWEPEWLVSGKTVEETSAMACSRSGVSILIFYNSRLVCLMCLWYSLLWKMLIWHLKKHTLPLMCRLKFPSEYCLCLFKVQYRSNSSATAEAAWIGMGSLMASNSWEGPHYDACN